MYKRKPRPEDAKTIQFPSLEELHVNLLLKLKFDDITKYFFFNECMKAFITEDPDFMPFLGKMKEKSMLARKFRTKKARELRKKEQEIKDRFALDTNDIEDIFDMIEHEEGV
tara:strand:- start:15 stop:350 length:336 start_codon:yes stop_codon:yes gene_type:complete